MIAGIGIDVVDVPRFAEQLAAPGTAFVDGTFTPGELRAASEAGPGDRATRLAARFAAKEAFVKAWSGSAWGRAPRLAAIDLRHVEVVRDAWGRVRLALHPDLARQLDADGITVTHLSLSHDGAVAAATVVLERPDRPANERPDEHRA